MAPDPQKLLIGATNNVNCFWYALPIAEDTADKTVTWLRKPILEHAHAAVNKPDDVIGVIVYTLYDAHAALESHLLVMPNNLGNDQAKRSVRLREEHNFHRFKGPYEASIIAVSGWPRSDAKVRVYEGFFLGMKGHPTVKAALEALRSIVVKWADGAPKEPEAHSFGASDEEDRVRVVQRMAEAGFCKVKGNRLVPLFPIDIRDQR